MGRARRTGRAGGRPAAHSRLHGSGSVRVPWAFDDEAVDVTRKFTHLKLSLMPYLGRVAEEAHTDGVPMMRPLVLELPHDRAGYTADTQYLLGDALLVAPVFRADGRAEDYVTERPWTPRVARGARPARGRARARLRAGRTPRRPAARPRRHDPVPGRGPGPDEPPPGGREEHGMTFTYPEVGATRTDRWPAWYRHRHVLRRLIVARWIVHT